ncbi:MAG TPA: RsmB/NOP family class I SAM-dependent RNA methyltransferase, partial [Burkholderiales bacterium]|nr:RsmB/NOP family class I SAM-dependent RNA methyltransferase [Burkholderiales bacterium]
GKPAINNHALFRDGLVEVQDEGSQLLAWLVAPRRGEMIVDFCAGAGGKTLALGALMRSTGRLYAFDISPRRLAGLKPRLARSGLSNVHPQRIEGANDARVKRLAGKIDRVLVDAPCSGLGTLRRNPDMKWRQTPQGVAELVEKQDAILAGAARLVKPGGRLVYATCSILDEENRGVAERFLAGHAHFHLKPAGGVLEKERIALNMEEYLELWPHVHGTDGFFAAVFERAA